MKKKYKPCAKCKKCYWGGQVAISYKGEMLYSCDYLILTGTRRPCPAGNACTVYSPKDKKERTIPNYTPKSRRRKKDGTLHR